ncbi:MAG: hypothetical protein E7463_12000 [Ruminococcaceae bacterium]|nr:hypothetical protein [Oscillospiraceae bacterium]
MKAGFGSADMTPYGGKTAVAGSIRLRYTDEVLDRLQAVAMVIQDEHCRTIWVSCDMCHPAHTLTGEIISRLSMSVVGFCPDELIINGTHATACCHTSDDEPQSTTRHQEAQDHLPLPELRRQITDAVEKAVLQAVENLCECRMDYALCDILTGFCRRTMYRDGRAVMYGDVYREDFLRMEYPDGGPTQVLYFYEAGTQRILGIFAAVPCPSQCDESNAHLSGDYWATVRALVREELGDDVKVVAACRAAGELSPHQLFRYGNFERPHEYGPEKSRRLGTLIAESILRERKRPVHSWDADALEHRRLTQTIPFPVRMPSVPEIEAAQAYMNDPDNFNEHSEALKPMEAAAHKGVLKRSGFAKTTYEAPVSALSIGNVLLYTAPCELFCEYAQRIASHFPRRAIIDVQLANDCLGYLPTQEAIDHGGYSTLLMSTVTTPAGGELLIETVCAMLDTLIGQE